MVELSIVVCTYNRAELLRECLSAFVGQDDPRYELIVVNNNSSDDTQATAEAVVAQLASARVVHEASQGLSFARNRGVAEARGTWIAFVDDDAVAAENYVARALHSPAREFDAFGGVYLPWYKYGRPAWFRDEYASNASVRITLGLLGDDQFMSGGNCVFHRRVFDENGSFPIEIGMNGKARSYGEETLVQIRMRKRGMRVGFDPALIVKHLVAPRKLTVSGQLRDNYAAGRDAFSAFDRPATLVGRAAALATCLGHARHLPDLLRKLTRPGYHVENFLIDACASPAYYLGQVVAKVPSR